jgi:hydroxyacylglutathione hydrolase
MELLTRTVGPVGTNVYVLADAASGEAIAIDTAIPSVAWVTALLAERGWNLKLIVSTHGHWDHMGDNAAVQAWTREQAEHRAAHLASEPERIASSTGHALASAGQDAEAPIAVHPLDRHRLTDPQPLFAPFPIPPCVPAVDLAEGGRIKFGDFELEVIHLPGHTEGSVGLVETAAGILFSGDTLFAGSWGRTDLPGGSDEQMVESLIRLAGMPDGLRVMPGHGAATTIGRERPWLELVKASGRLPS